MGALLPKKYEECDIVDLENSVQEKIVTMSEIVSEIDKTKDSALVNTVFQFKLSMVRRSLCDLYNMIEAKNIVQDALYEKIRDEIDAYPIATILEILESMDKIMDRNIKIMESILPAQDELQKLTSSSASKAKTVNIVNSVNINPSAVNFDKIQQVLNATINKVKDVESQLNSKDSVIDI